VSIACEARRQGCELLSTASTIDRSAAQCLCMSRRGDRRSARQPAGDDDSALVVSILEVVP
jgi:hypothetical protein